MLNRRHLIISATAVASSISLPVLGQTARRPNPMPEELRKAIERDPNAPVLGNPHGNITLTEFFDYNCPYCRKMVAPMSQLIEFDPELRVVYREWPVFGEGSEFAARASLAALVQGKYWQLHTRMMGMRGQAVEATVMRAVREVGLDETKLRQDMESERVAEHISTSNELANHLGLIGTPYFIAGDEGHFGELTLDQLQELVARAREMLG